MKYKIGPVTIEIQNLHSNQLVNRLVTFCISEKKYDLLYNVSYYENIHMPLKKHIVYENEQIIVAKKGSIKQYYHIFQGVPYALVEEISMKNYNIILLNDIVKIQKVHPYFFLELLHLERVMVNWSNLVLHSSYINVNNGAILFTAPSGGGKSTQAELWKKYKNAEIINGDKSIIGKEDGQWNVYGIPFSGSSEYCLNKTFPLKAIVILDKGPVNEFKRIDIKGFSNVFSQVTVNPWDREFCEKAMDLVMDVCNEVPIYYYSCTKTQEAVEVLYREFVEKGVLNGAV